MWTFLKRRTLTQWILVGMVAGAVLGWAAPDVGTGLQPLSTLFLRAIKSIIVPLVFSTLVGGIAGHGDDLKKVGRLAVRAIVYFEVVTTLALVVGLALVNAVRPGVGVALGNAAAAGPVAESKTTLGDGAPAHRPAELLRGGGAERGAAGGVLVRSSSGSRSARSRASRGRSSSGSARAWPR